METVILAALGVGLSTVLGAVMGFIFKGAARKYSDVTLSFAAGVMLSASFTGLILPALDYGKWALAVTVLGIFSGALIITLLDYLMPHIYTAKEGGELDSRSVGRVLLFVLAIAIHNFPEGLAAGVGFGAGEGGEGLFIALAIAIQNIPEGMVIIGPMLSAGIKPRRTFVYAALTGFIEVVGTFVGYFAVRLATALLPFMLSLAGGTMIYVIVREMIPTSHGEGSGEAPSYAFLVGLALMLVFYALL
ncbi:MAG: ZIP family metal transporter [Clostridia bacterium]|nr:ZIP family metal transporter [Clostridia bacterium]